MHEDFDAEAEADTGVRARTKRGSIGARWWSRRFIDLVESFADKGRLQRGRTYARKGNVFDLRVAPYEVTAKVRGSAPEPYEVALGIEAIDDAGWRAAEAELASRAVFRARLLAGEMPPEIEWVFAELGLALFPGTASDLHLMCDCPDWGDPCKHAAAVLYLLAEAFDDDPFLILEWNGRGRDRLLAALRRGSGPGAEPDPFEMADEPLTAAGFWTPPSGLAGLRERPPAPPVPPGFVLRVATPPPVRVRRRDLTDVLAPAYESLAAPPPA
ncbi:SWIM zinc finger family protein [Actinomadura macra]|uniref:SWIM zinc finger family protein n=1 Tax=Actinomadura macra TaxID=46164 RepID=UPI0008368D35|nr:SWIM zinc finger family protein [Actinomadura macra]